MATLNEYRTVKEKLSDLFLVPNAPLPQIHGVGIGRTEANDYQVRIYVTEHNPRIFALLANFLGILPLPAAFPIILGEIEIREIICPPAVFATVPAGNDFKITDDCKRITPLGNKNTDLKKLIAGISVGIDKNSMGTIGYFCRKANSSSQSTDVFILSNSHVIANFGTAPANSTEIIREGRYNGIRTMMKIGKLTQSIPLVFASGSNVNSFARNKLDAAIAKISQPFDALLSGKNLTFSVDGVVPADENGRTIVPKNQNVTKHGLGSCWTGGMIDDVDCDFIMAAGTKRILFVNQFRIVGKDKKIAGEVTFATKGDSGSLVFENPPLLKSGINKVKAVALVFAIGYKNDLVNSQNSAPNTKYTLATPISMVKKELEITLLGEP